MKKLYNILALLLIAFTFGGCTLSMEEWLDDPATGEVPEELRGVDEPYTEIIPDVITVTYKYNPGVRPVTTKHRGYLAYIEADTILYFYDNMPKDLLPLEGEYLAAGITPQFPTGLNHRVLAVSHEGGLYKVVTTLATMNEVYDDLIYELDLAYVPPLNDFMEEDSTSELEYSDGAENSKIVVTDWSIYNKVKGLTDEDIKFIKRANTRSIIHSEPKIITRGSGDNNSKVDSVSWGFTYRSDLNLDDNAGTKKTNWFDKIFGKEIKEIVQRNNKFLPNNSSIYLELSLCNKTVVRAYSLVNKDDEYDKTYTETTETFKLGMAMGVDLGQRFSLGSDAEDGNILKSSWQKANQKFKFEKLKEAIGRSKVLGAIAPKIKRLKDVEIALNIGATVPVQVVFKAGLDLNFNFNGNVAVFKETGDYRCEGYEYNKGKKSPIQRKRTLPTDYSFTGSGTLLFSLIPNVSVGFRFIAGSDKVGALGVDFGIDGNIKLIEAKAEIGTTDNLKGPIYTDASIGSSCIINPFVNFYAELFGWNLWSNKLTFEQYWTLWNTASKVHPTLVQMEVPGSLRYRHDGTPIIDYTYIVSDLGCGFGNSDYLPTLTLFKNDINDKNIVAVLAPDDVPIDEKIERKKVYNYSFAFDESEEKFDPNNKYIGVPTLYNEDSDSYMYYTNSAYVFSDPKPYLNSKNLKQLYAMDVGDDPQFSDYIGMIKYQFQIELEGNNVKSAKDYGIMVDIPFLNLYGHSISLSRYNFYNNLSNRVTITFYTDYEANDRNEPIEVFVYSYLFNNNKDTYGDMNKITLEYPMEYNDDADRSNIDVTVN